MRVEFELSQPSGEVIAPPSKSMSHRLLICAALSPGESRIENVNICDDALATMDCVHALGASCSVDGSTVTVRGCDPRQREETLFPCRESGSTLRFVLPLAALSGERAAFTGSPRLMERGAKVYIKPFSDHGVFLNTGEHITMEGRLTGGKFCLPGNVSSQFISGLLFALPFIGGEIELISEAESRPYIGMTKEALSIFGVTVRGLETTGSYHPADCTVEGDWSNAAPLLALNTLGGSVTVRGLAPSSSQGDRVCEKAFSLLSKASPQIDVRDCPDLAPVLMAVAAAKHGARLTGTRRLGLKESDRAQTMARELRKLGAEVTVFENEVVIGNTGVRAPKETLCGHNDHRVVMALSVLLSLTGGTLDGAEAVGKSFPGWFDTLSSINVMLTKSN